jgi:hypothetical protein
MARDIIIKDWCDRHLDLDERVEAQTYQVGLDGVWRDVDLCKECYADTLQAVTVLLDQHGRTSEQTTKPVNQSVGQRSLPLLLEQERRGKRQGRKPSRERGWPCLFCGLAYGSTSGLQAHLRAHHGFKTVGEAVGTRCPLCGMEYVSLSNHFVRTHADEGLTTAMQYFALANESGDPHGVIAERRAAEQANKK